MIRTGNTKKRAGQTIIFLMVVLVILVLAVVWQFDIHKILRVKGKTQDAGDAAALVAARWQGITLNLIGDLNIMKAAALTHTNSAALNSISNLQARLCYTGPMIGFMASQQAAKNNGIYANQAYTSNLVEHADNVRNDYGRIGPGGKMLFPEPYSGCWQDYASMLSAVARNGVAAGPDNASLYTDYAGSHTLLQVDFYEAIAGRNWCWFYHHKPDLLDDYQNFFPRWWSDLPPVQYRHYINSEIFGLGLARRRTTLDSFFDSSEEALAVVQTNAEARGLDTGIDTNALGEALWYCYNESAWSQWSERDRMPTEEDPRPGNAFPMAGTVKSKYDYTGADAAVRIKASTGRLTPGSGGSRITNRITWTAAAKPFGHLENDTAPNAYGLVLPAFREVRLIPIDASSAPYGGAYNLDWRDHIEDHLPDYMEHGPQRLASGCWYCRQLKTWEDSSFRQDGLDWLNNNSHLCTLTTSGGGRGGGTRRGH
jgi:hypothetical protein